MFLSLCLFFPLSVFFPLLFSLPASLFQHIDIRKQNGGAGEVVFCFVFFPPDAQRWKTHGEQGREKSGTDVKRADTHACCEC